MLIFIYGPDSYRLKCEKSELLRRYKNKYPSSINLFSFDLSEKEGFSRLIEAVKHASFFSEHKLIFCRNLFNNEPAAGEIRRLIEESEIISAPDLTLAIVENLDKKILAGQKNLFNFISGNAKISREVDFLEGQRLFEWIGGEFKARGSDIGSGAVRKLAGIVGNDSNCLINEIEKLSNYKNGGRVAEDDVDLLVSRENDLNIFNLVDAVVGKSESVAAQLLYKELRTGRDPYYILTMIVYQIRNMLLVLGLKEQGLSRNEIIAKSKLHPFVAQKTFAALVKFDRGKLIKIHRYILSLDIGFKTGRIDLEDGLFRLLIFNDSLLA